MLLLMTAFFPMSEPSRGRISAGPTDALVEQTLEFVSTELTGWRDDPDRTPEAAEERLNAQLCKYLNVVASRRFPMVHFSHEEKQTGTRRVDLAANPNPAALIGQTYHTIYDPFLVFEGKRLPAPAANREKEYVTGGSEKSGGIQRFKLALHGAQQTTAAMIGYIQKDDAGIWLSLINRWIREAAGGPTASDERWSLDDQLTSLAAHPVLDVATFSSVHKRVGTAISPEIRIRHIWVVMKS